jgi:hypothetical protein
VRLFSPINPLDRPRAAKHIRRRRGAGNGTGYRGEAEEHRASTLYIDWEEQMIALFVSWIVAQLAVMGLFVFETVGLTAVVAAGVLVTSVLVALLIRNAVEELKATQGRGHLERGRTWKRRAPRSAAVPIRWQRRNAQVPG